jgi:transposase
MPRSWRYRNGDLTAVWVPDAAHEALRDLVRAREDAKQDQHRARQRLGKFLLRHGTQPPAEHQEKRTAKYMTWLNTHVHFGQPALPATLVDYVHEVHHVGERIARLLLLRSVSGQRNCCLVTRARSHKTNRHMQSTPAAWVDS